MSESSPEISELDKLQDQIDRLKSDSLPKPSDSTPVGMGLVFSLGFTVLGAMMVGEHFGRYLAEKAGNPRLGLVGWVLGLGLAMLASSRLLRPYLK